MSTADQTPTTASDDNVIDGAIAEVKPDNALVVIDPTRYATELFAPFQTELATAKRSAARKTYDIKTDAGMDMAKELRTTFVKIRTRAEKAKTEAKRPIDQAGKKILEIYNALEAAAKAEEKKHGDVIAAREAEIAAEVQRKLDEQRARTEAIENRIALIRNYPATLAKADSGAIETALAKLVEKQMLPADYDDQLEDALTAFNATVDRVREMLTEAQEREAAERKAKADADELARLKAEAAEREKRETEEREKREADEKAKADAAAKLAADQAQMIADLQAKLAAATAPPVVELAPEPAPAPEEPASAAGVEIAGVIINTGDSDDGIVTDSSGTELDQQEVRRASFGYGSVYRATPAPSEPAKPARPGDDEIIGVLAEHFAVDYKVAGGWLVEMDREKLAISLSLLD